MCSNRNLENCCHQINNLININKDRETYTSSFNYLRDTIFAELKKDDIMKSLFDGYQLGGSYGDNLKVTKPDEFDLVFHLKFPEYNHIIVQNHSLPGNVTLNMSEVLKRMQDGPIKNHLRKLVDDKNMLLQDKLHSWVEGLVTKTMNKLNFIMNFDNQISTLQYRKSGPAHTIYVTGPCVYSVDFVPAVKLNYQQNVLPKEKLKYFVAVKHLGWEAIPKPLKQHPQNNISFRSSYYEAEHQMLKNKNNLKPALRIMKQYRDSKPNLRPLKSYFIKTMFLWQIDEKDNEYWNKNLATILIEMFDILERNLERNGKLLFFWHPRLDMFQQLSSNQKSQIFNCVHATLNKLRNVDRRPSLTEEDLAKICDCFYGNRQQAADGIPNVTATGPPNESNTNRSSIDLEREVNLSKKANDSKCCIN